MAPHHAGTAPTQAAAPADPARGRGHPLLAPIMLSREEASAYVGVGADVFSDEVAAGLWPAPICRGAKGRKLTWYRPDLDAAAERLAHSGQRRDPEPVAVQPQAVAPDTAEGDRAIADRLRASIQRAPSKRR